MFLRFLLSSGNNIVYMYSFFNVLLVLYTELIVLYERQQFIECFVFNTVLVLLLVFNIEWVGLLDIEVNDGTFYPSF